jgi:hypothetical protein
MHFLNESFIQENVVAKAKQYDFLPIAYNFDIINHQVRTEFQDKKLNT